MYLSTSVIVHCNTYKLFILCSFFDKFDLFYAIKGTFCLLVRGQTIPATLCFYRRNATGVLQFNELNISIKLIHLSVK